MAAVTASASTYPGQTGAPPRGGPAPSAAAPHERLDSGLVTGDATPPRGDATGSALSGLASTGPLACGGLAWAIARAWGDGGMLVSWGRTWICPMSCSGSAAG